MTGLIPNKNEWYVSSRIATYDEDQKVALLMTNE